MTFNDTVSSINKVFLFIAIACAFIFAFSYVFTTGLGLNIGWLVRWSYTGMATMILLILLMFTVVLLKDYFED
jgi:hypothetical protein